jgi:asparagine synthase (glutamine-hydrolysing)
LLINGHIDATYFTFGEPNGDDTRVARAITAKFGLKHEFMSIDEDEVISNWEEKAKQNVRATDGMRSLYLLAGLSKSQALDPKRRDIYFWGACGEVARCYYGDLPFLKSNPTIDVIKERLKRSGPGDTNGLVNPDAVGRARRWRNEYIDYCADQGIGLLDIPDVYGTHAVDARRLGNNGRALATTRDTYTPYATRAFLEATFSLPAMQRLTEPLHYRLTEYLVPALHRMPLANNKWRTQNSLLNLLQMRGLQRGRHIKTKIAKVMRKIHAIKPMYRYRDSMFNRLNWLERERQSILELASDSTVSSVWNFVERAKFERIMSSDTHPSLRSQNLQLLFHIATLLHYEALREEQPDDWVEGRTGTEA